MRRLFILITASAFFTGCSTDEDKKDSIRKCENPGDFIPELEEAKPEFDRHIKLLSSLIYTPDTWKILSADRIEVAGVEYSLTETTGNEWEIKEGDSKLGYIKVAKFTFEERIETMACTQYRLTLKFKEGTDQALDGWASYARL